VPTRTSRPLQDQDVGTLRFAHPTNAAPGTRTIACFAVLARHELLRGLRWSPSRKVRGRSADRRSGACEAPFAGQLRRPADADRRVLRPAQIAYAIRAPGTPAFRRSVAAVFWLRPALANHAGIVPSGFTLLRSQVPLVVAEGRYRRTPPGGRGYEPARRTPHPVPSSARLRKTPSVNGTAGRCHRNAAGQWERGTSC
jgi:hypothetical protein